MLDWCAYSTLLLRSLVSNKPTCKKNNRERKKTTHTHPCLTEIRNARTCLEFNRAKMFFNRLSNATYLSNLYLNLNPPFKTCCLAAHVPGTHAPQTRWGKKWEFHGQERITFSRASCHSPLPSGQLLQAVCSARSYSHWDVLTQFGAVLLNIEYPERHPGQMHEFPYPDERLCAGKRLQPYSLSLQPADSFCLFWFLSRCPFAL